METPKGKSSQQHNKNAAHGFKRFIAVGLTFIMPKKH
jgi:hypothetical protein